MNRGTWRYSLMGDVRGHLSLKVLYITVLILICTLTHTVINVYDQTYSVQEQYYAGLLQSDHFMKA